MKNTNYANGRPRSVKPKKRTGFTMMEMMITLAIMAILFGLAVPAVAQIQKNLEIARLNSYAKDVYLAAQSRLTSMKATGELNQLLEDLRDDGVKDCSYLTDVVTEDGDVKDYTALVPQDWAKKWNSDDYMNFYGIMHDPDATDDAAIAENVFASKYLISEASVAATTLDQHYYIEFNPYTGDVYAAFYSDAKTGFTSADIHENTLNEIKMGGEIDETKEGRKSSFRKKFPADSGEIMIGYYRGDPTDMLKPSENKPFRPICEIINKEDLYVRVSCEMSAEAFALYQQGIGKSEVVLTATDTYTKTQAHVTIPLRVAELTAADSRADYSNTVTHYVCGSVTNYTPTAYILLDSLDRDGDTPNIETILNDSTISGGDGDDKAAFLAMFKNGCDLEVTANFEIKLGDLTILTEPGSDIVAQHSLFASAETTDGGVLNANVSYLRHLRNLNNYGAVAQSKHISEFNIVQQSVREETPRINATTGEEMVDADGNVVMDDRPADIYFKSSDTYMANKDGDIDTVVYWTDAEMLVPGTPLENPISSMKPITLGGNIPATYDGNGFGLYDFDIVGSTANIGLFATTKNMTFKNVTLVDAKVRAADNELGRDHVGGLVGSADATTFQNCAVRLRDENPIGVKYFEGVSRLRDRSIYAEKSNNVGGMVGKAQGCTFADSYAAVWVQGQDSVGGLVGNMDSGAINRCYTSEDTVGGSRVGGMVGNMKGATVTGVTGAPCYATGDVQGTQNVGGFVGAAQDSDFINANSYGKVIDINSTKNNVHGFVGKIGGSVSDSTFVACNYLTMNGYNKSLDADPSGAQPRLFGDFALLNADDGTYANSADDSHPYTISETVFPFPMLKESKDTNGDGQVDSNDAQKTIPHYGDWPVESTVQTCMVYYEKYEDGTYGFDVCTSLKGDNDSANTWVYNSLWEGDFTVVEDGYAILSSDRLTDMYQIGENGQRITNGTLGELTQIFNGNMVLASGSNKVSENVFIYPLPNDLQGMSDAYENAMKQTNATYYQKLILSGYDNSATVFENYTFYYNPVLAKTVINPTPEQVDHPFDVIPGSNPEKRYCPTAADMPTPSASIIRSARQLNALGRINWYWDKNFVFKQECHVNFSKYTKNYIGLALDLSGAGQKADNPYRNVPIGTEAKPFAGMYDGGGNRIYDYCQETTGVSATGLFGVIDGACVQNVILMAESQETGTAFIRTSDATDVAPLVGRVKNGAYVAPASGGGTSTDRKLVEAKRNGFDSADNKSSLDSSAGTFTFSGDQSMDGQWRDLWPNLIPASDEEYTVVTVTGDFSGVMSARLYYQTQDHSWDPVVVYLDTSDAIINEDGSQVTFTLHEADFHANADTGEKAWKAFNLQLTGGNLTTWTKEGTSISIVKYTTAAASAGGATGDEGPSAYLQQGVTTVKNCAVAGYVIESTANRAHVGGLAGTVIGQVQNCSAVNKTIDAVATDNVYVGGFAGDNQGVVAMCYAGGMLKGYATGNTNAQIAGLVGNQNGGVLCDCYNYCQFENNASHSSKFYGVAGGATDKIIHSHFFVDAITKQEDGYFAVSSTDGDGNVTWNLSDKLLDKGRNWEYSITVKDTDANGNDLETTHTETRTVPYGLTYSEMKKLFSGGEYALRGTSGIADFDHSWPYDQTLAGGYPFPAVVTVNSHEYFESQDGLLDSDGNPVSGWKDVHRFSHFGDWILPPGTIFSNETAFNGTFWADFCVDPTFNTDYRYYWDAWLKEMKYQASIGNLKAGDYIEIIVEPEFKYDRYEAVGKFQCAIHTLLKDTTKNVWDDVNDAAYEAQGIHFTNGQVYQFLFDVADTGIMQENDPQLWFAVNYHSAGGLKDGSLWGSLNKKDAEYYPGNEDPFRINRLMVNIYRANTTSSTTNTTTRKSTTGSSAGTTAQEQPMQLKLLKEWTFEEAGAENILVSSKAVKGEITDLCGAGTATDGQKQHSNRVVLNDDGSLRMNIGSAWKLPDTLQTGEGYQVEATFTLDAQDAIKDANNAYPYESWTEQKAPLALQPVLVQPIKDDAGNIITNDFYYANEVVVAQAVQKEGNNKGKIVWSQPVLYTFGAAGKTFDSNAYIRWESPIAGKTLNGTLYVDNVSVKKLEKVNGQSSSSSSSTPADVSDPKLQDVFRSPRVGDVSAPTYQTSSQDQYRNASLGGTTCKDVDTGITWTQFLKQHESLTESQYMEIKLTYPAGFANAELDDFTFTCDSYAYNEGTILSEIKAKSIDTANRTVTYEIYGPLERSQAAEYGSMNLRTFFTYRNALDLTDNKVLKDGLEDQFFVDVRIYDRSPSATEMPEPTQYVPPEEKKTRELSGGTVSKKWTSNDGEVKNYWIQRGSMGTVEGSTTPVSFTDFVNANPLTDSQYMVVTVINNDTANNPFTCAKAEDAKFSCYAYNGIEDAPYKNISARELTSNKVVFHVNGPLTPLAEPYLSFENVVAATNGQILKTSGLQVEVAIYSTETTATLQLDNFDVAAGEISKVGSITLNGDEFASVNVGDDITGWFDHLGVDESIRDLAATVRTVNGNVLSFDITGSVSALPANNITVTVTVPGDKMKNGGTAVTAGSFVIGPKVAKAEIVGDNLNRTFYRGEPITSALDGHPHLVNLKISNTTFTSNFGSVADWIEGTLPAGMGIDTIGADGSDGVTITLSGTPTEDVSGLKVTFVVPASATTFGQKLTAGTITFNVTQRPTVETPSITVNGTSPFRGSVSFNINCATTDATVWYQILDADGNVVKAAQQYTGATTTEQLDPGTYKIEAWAERTGYTSSDHFITPNAFEILEDKNLIKNGSFDNGLSDWKLVPSNSADAFTITSDGKLKIQKNYYSLLSATATYNKDIEGGKTYRLSFDMDSSNLRVEIHNKLGSGDGAKIVLNSSVKNYEFSVDAGVSSKGASDGERFYIQVVGDKNTDLLGTFDNFYLEEVTGTGPVEQEYTIAVTKGSATVANELVAKAVKNTVVTLTADTPDTGKVFDKWVVSTGSTAVTFANAASATTTFTMPEGNVAVEATYKDAGTSSSASSSSTSTPSGERTKIAQWVTTEGITGGHLETDGTGTMRVDWNNVGSYSIVETKESGSGMSWSNFLTKVQGASLFTSDAYLEIVFESLTDNPTFGGAVAAKTTLESKCFAMFDKAAIRADDKTIVFQTDKGLTFNGNQEVALLATLQDVTSVLGGGQGRVTVTLYTGSTGGGETSESDTSTSASSETSTSATSEPETYTNLIVNGNFANGLNGWTLDKISSTNAQVTGGKLVVSKDTNDGTTISASFTETIQSNTEYTFMYTGTGLNNLQVEIHKETGWGQAATLVATPDVPLTFTTGSVDNTDNGKFTVKIASIAKSTPISGTFDNFILVKGNHIPSGGDPEDTPHAITVTGGTANATEAKKGVTVQLTPGTPSAGQKFDHWNVISGDVTVNADNTFVMGDKDVVIEGIFEDIEYSITVQNGAANLSKAKMGASVTLSNPVVQVGQTFDHWEIVSPSDVTITNANSPSGASFTMPASDVTVKAVINKINYTVTVTVNPTSAAGTVKVLRNNVETTVVNVGDEVTLKATPNDGYTFSSWTVTGATVANASSETTTISNITGDVKITANFEKTVVPTYGVTVENGTVDGGTTQFVEGTTVSITANDPEPGYKFDKWTSSDVTITNASSAKGATFTMPAKAVTVTATFVKETYTITCASVTGGTLSVNPTTAQMGETVTVTAKPSDGYTLGGITMNGAAVTGNTFTMPAGDVTVSATFNQQSYDITVNNDTNKGTVTVPASAHYGDTVNLSVAPKPGWTFDKWTSSDGVTITNATSATDASFTMPANAVEITANYKADPTTAVASWTSNSVSTAYRDANGVATITVGNISGSTGTTTQTLNEFLSSHSIGTNQYLKVTFEKTGGKFGNARRAATTLSGATTAYADDIKLEFYSKSNLSGDIAVTYTNASAVPGNDEVKCTLAIYNYTTDPIASINQSDKDATYTVTVDGGTADSTSGTYGKKVTVTPATQSGKTFVGWELGGDGTDYLYLVADDQNNKDNPLVFTMPYNNVSIKAKFETAATEPTPTDGNLIKNGTFDVTDRGASGFGWTGNPDGLTFSNGVANIGNGNDDSKTLYQMVNFVAGRSYTISFNVDVTYKSIKLSLDGVNAATAIEDKNGGVFTYSFVADSTMNQVRFIGTQATFTLDNVVLVEEGGSTPTTSEPSDTPTNLIVNGDFANGMTGWTVNNGGTATVQNGVLTIPSQEFYPDLKISASLISGYTIKQNAQYTLKFDMTSSNPDSLYVKIRPGINDNGLVSCKESGKYTFTTTADVTTDKFEIWIHGAKSIPGLSATFDNVWLVEGDGSNIPSGGGGSETSETTPAAGNLLDSYSWETVSGGMTTNGNAMELKANGKSSADFRMKNIALEAGTYTLTGSVVNGFTNALEFHIGSQTETVPAGATQNISITLNVAAATSVDLQMIASSYPGGPATVTGLALTKS